MLSVKERLKRIDMELKAWYLLILTSLLDCQQVEGCCLPEKWQATSGIQYTVQTQLNKTLQVQTTYWQQYWDGVGERVMYSMHPGPVSMVLTLFKQRTGYVIGNGNCTKFSVGKFPNKTVCFPKGRVSPPYKLGYKPIITVRDHFVYGNTIMTLTDSCVPVTTKWFNDEAAGDTYVGGFMPTITDYKVFKVPDICKHAEQGESDLLSKLPLRFVWEAHQ